MARQYGAPQSEKWKGDKPSYVPERKDPKPLVASPDPAPSARQVEFQHRNAPTDTRPQDKHHTLGPSANQASPGDHRHRGGDSALLLNEFTLTGSKASYNATLIGQIVQCLKALGAKDSTT